MLIPSSLFLSCCTYSIWEGSLSFKVSPARGKLKTILSNSLESRRGSLIIAVASTWCKMVQPNCSRSCRLALALGCFSSSSSSIKCFPTLNPTFEVYIYIYIELIDDWFRNMYSKWLTSRVQRGSDHVVSRAEYSG